MTRLAILIGLALVLAACAPTQPPASEPPHRPQRIVSLDYCADQFVLKFADRDQILAVSPDAGKSFSYMRDAAVGLPTVRSLAEDVLILKPDLVVRSYGGGPNAEAFFERAGVPVLNVGWASRLDGEGEGTIPALIRNMAGGLGQADRGEALVAEFRQRLARLKADAKGGVALYVPPSGVTSGPGSMIHEMILAAGYENFETRSGWRSIDLERLAREQPDIVVAASFRASSTGQDAWSPMKHPVAKSLLFSQEIVPIEGAWTACGGWFILDAVETMAEGAKP